MIENRRNFVKLLAGAGLVSTVEGLSTLATPLPPWGGTTAQRKIPVALVQFDAIAEQVERNLQEIERLASQAVNSGARWVMFHEDSLCDYTPRVKELSEPVPAGPSVRRMERLAHRLNCYISFGMSESDRDRYYITQVFVGPEGFVYRYRKTWLWLTWDDSRYRNEWVRYDPGTGPEAFMINGIKATCFICADGDAPRCTERAATLKPEVVFYPNNRERLPGTDYFGARAHMIKAPMLVTNRVGRSWWAPCNGGSGVYGADGQLLAEANREGKEEILIHTLEV